MITDFLRKEINTSSFFTLLFGLSGWAALVIGLFYFMAWINTPAVLCGYYLEHQHSYRIRAYWLHSADVTVYETFNGEEAVKVLGELNKQFTPLLNEKQKPKNL